MEKHYKPSSFQSHVRISIESEEEESLRFGAEIFLVSSSLRRLILINGTFSPLNFKYYILLIAFISSTGRESN